MVRCLLGEHKRQKKVAMQAWAREDSCVVKDAFSAWQVHKWRKITEWGIHRVRHINPNSQMHTHTHTYIHWQLCIMLQSPEVLNSGLGWDCMYLRPSVILSWPETHSLWFAFCSINSFVAKTAVWAVRRWGATEWPFLPSHLCSSLPFYFYKNKHTNTSSDKCFSPSNCVIKAEKQAKKKTNTKLLHSSFGGSCGGCRDCFRPFQAVVLSYKWKQNNSVGASWVSGGSRTSYLESWFHIKPTSLPSLTPLAMYLPSSHPFSLLIQPTSLHITALSVLLLQLFSHSHSTSVILFGCLSPTLFLIFQSFSLTVWLTVCQQYIHLCTSHYAKGDDCPLCLSLPLSVHFLYISSFLSLCLPPFVCLRCSTYASQQSRFPYLRL